MTTNGDPFGPLAALFTSGDGAPAPAPGADDALRLPPVVTVLVGNLPVLAGLWTTQLADQVSRVAGPTALVRFERGEVIVELLRAEGRQLPPASPNAVSRWLPRGASTARRWIVCLPAEAPPAEVLSGGTDILIMTGADEAAVTSAYLRLKYLAEEATHRGAPLERVGVVIVGAGPEQCAGAAARLSETARSFLGIEVEVVARLPRLERVESSARGSYPAAESPSFEGFMRELARARSDAPMRFGAEPAIDLAVEPKQAPPAARTVPVDGELRTAPPTPALPTEPALRHVPAAAHVPPAEPPAPAPAVEPTVAPAPAPVMAAPAAPAPVNVATAVAAFAAALPPKLVPLLRGLRPLGIACPVAPDVELALDDANRLHLVGRGDQLARVRTARHWAETHRELLGLAFPELRGGTEVRERLLLAHAREAIPLHGTGVLLDLLVTAEAPTGPVQVVVPLNDPTTAG